MSVYHFGGFHPDSVSGRILQALTLRTCSRNEYKEALEAPAELMKKQTIENSEIAASKSKIVMSLLLNIEPVIHTIELKIRVK